MLDRYVSLNVDGLVVDVKLDDEGVVVDAWQGRWRARTTECQKRALLAAPAALPARLFCPNRPRRPEAPPSASLYSPSLESSERPSWQT